MSQERVQKRKSGERRAEIKILKIKKENDADLSLSPIKEEKEESKCAIIEDDDTSDKHSNTSADTASDDSNTDIDLELPIFNFC